MSKLSSRIIYLSIYLSMIVSSVAHAQSWPFQPSSNPDREIPMPIPNHIRDITCHSYGDLLFADYPSDLYISTNSEGTAGIHYKRTHIGRINKCIIVLLP